MSGDPTRDQDSAQSLSGAILVIIPTYNEKPNIARLLDEILELGPSYAALVIDDSSPDGTSDVVNAIAKRGPNRVSLLQRPRKEGIGQAYIAGFRVALG